MDFHEKLCSVIQDGYNQSRNQLHIYSSDLSPNQCLQILRHKKWQTLKSLNISTLPLLTHSQTATRQAIMEYNTYQYWISYIYLGNISQYFMVQNRWDGYIKELFFYNLIIIIMNPKTMNPEPKIEKKLKIIFDTSTGKCKYVFQHMQDQLLFQVAGVDRLHSVKIKQVAFSRVLHYQNKQIFKLFDKFDKFDENWWVVLPTYFRQDEQFFYITDVQLGLTGGIQVQKDYDAQQATIRQTQQEVGLNVAGEKIIWLEKNGEPKTSESKTKKIYVSIIPIQNLKQQNIDIDEINKIDNVEQSGSKERIQTWILIKDIYDPIFLKRRSRQQAKIVTIINIKSLRKLLEIVFTEQYQDQAQKVQNNKDFEQNQQQISSSEEQEDYWTYDKSVEMQQKLSRMKYQQIDKFIDQHQKKIHNLAQLRFGHYVFQGLCNLCNEAQIQRILKLIALNFSMIAGSKYGTFSCQTLIKNIIEINSEQLIKLARKITFENFYQIAKTNPGCYYLRNFIQIFPIMEILKLKQKLKSKYQKDFKPFISRQSSEFVIQDLIAKAYAASIDNNQKAIQLQYKFVKRLRKQKGWAIVDMGKDCVKLPKMVKEHKEE